MQSRLKWIYNKLNKPKEAIKQDGVIRESLSKYGLVYDNFIAISTLHI